MDEPVFDEPLAEVPSFDDEPAFEEPVFEEPVLDEPVAEETFADEPTLVDEPVAAAVPVAVESENGGRSFGRKRNGAPAEASARKSGRGRGKKIVGLKIGASQIAAAVVTETSDGHELVQLARKPIDSGLVVDGEVKDADALAHALKTFFDEHKLPKKDVRIGVASNRIGVRTFEIAGIDDEARFDNAVRFKAHEVLPVAQHESVLDYRVLEERPNEAGEPSRRILLVVAPRDQIEPYTQVAQNAGIRLSGVDLEALSLLRAFVDPKPFAVRAVDDTATVVVSIGHESTHAARRRRRRLRVHPRVRVGRRHAPGRGRAGARRPCGGGGDDPASPLALRPRPAARDARRGRTDEGGRGGADAAHPVRPRARQLAAVLPDPAGLARHRRDRDHRRHLAPRGPLRTRCTR